MTSSACLSQEQASVQTRAPAYGVPQVHKIRRFPFLHSDLYQLKTILIVIQQSAKFKCYKTDFGQFISAFERQ